MPGKNRQLQHGQTLLVTLVCASLLACATIAPRPVLGQRSSERQGIRISLRADDLVTLVTRCGGADALDESLEVFQEHACSRGRSGTGKILAFEENRWFVYALADMSQGRGAENSSQPQQTALRLRRVFLLKPSTLVVEDVVRSASPESPIRWTLRCDTEPKIEAGRFRVTEANTAILGRTAFPEGATLEKTERPARDDRPAGFRVELTPGSASKDARFLHVFHLGQNAETDALAAPKVAGSDENIELTVTGSGKAFRMALPAEGAAAGKIEITAADGTVLVPSRLLPSGVMPHGPAGAGLMERWDAPYRGDQLPGWDVGRPCSHLVKAVEEKTFKPGRAIVLGCGSGNNAIYLASQGFEVTGVDVSPTALSIAAKKAREADVHVDWILADVVALPELQPFDLIFDRGCYHHICQYDSPAYVETLRRLSHAGTRAMILAGRPAEGSRGGPPRIKEETIRRDFSTLFKFEWLQEIYFDSRNPEVRSAEAWSIHLRRKDD